MVYATWAEDFDRADSTTPSARPQYLADYLTSYELGWKTSWAGHRLRFSGAIYQEDWKDFQFTFKRAEWDRHSAAECRPSAAFRGSRRISRGCRMNAGYFQMTSA